MQGGFRREGITFSGKDARCSANLHAPATPFDMAVAVHYLTTGLKYDVGP